jgi:hypothetical protein
MTLSSCVALLITFPGIDDNVSVPNFLGHLIIHAPGVFAACLVAQGFAVVVIHLGHSDLA